MLEIHDHGYIFDFCDKTVPYRVALVVIRELYWEVYRIFLDHIDYAQPDEADSRKCVFFLM